MKRLLVLAALTALLTTQASALEFTYDPPADYLFGRPTSQDAPYTQEDPNVDRSKNVALIPPSFGSPTSYLPGSGEYLIPNLVPGALNGGLVNQIGSASSPNGYSSLSPAAIPDSNFSYTSVQANTQTTSFTEVTSGHYYAGGHLGTLNIPAIGLSVKVVQGTDSAALSKGAGHFPDTSIWNGNVCLAAHNRGTNSYFGKIHTLNIGDSITLTTKEGTRTYSVTSVDKISENDASGTAASSSNQITLYTCVKNERDYRWCVKGVEM